jgi:hypothetical protein
MFTLTSVGVRIAFGSTRYFTAKQNVGRVKSFVDDLIMFMMLRQISEYTSKGKQVNIPALY